MHTELGSSQVEVQVRTELGSWRRAWRRVGKAEVEVEVDADEEKLEEQVRRRRRRRMARKRRTTTLIKSNNPHLAGGGKKHQVHAFSKLGIFRSQLNLNRLIPWPSHQLPPVPTTILLGLMRVMSYCNMEGTRITRVQLLSGLSRQDCAIGSFTGSSVCYKVRFSLVKFVCRDFSRKTTGLSFGARTQPSLIYGVSRLQRQKCLRMISSGNFYDSKVFPAH